MKVQQKCLLCQKTKEQVALMSQQACKIKCSICHECLKNKTYKDTNQHLLELEKVQCNCGVPFDISFIHQSFGGKDRFEWKQQEVMDEYLKQIAPEEFEN